MAIYKGDKKVIALYKGDKKIIKKYKGTQLLYDVTNSGGEDIEVTPYTLTIDWSRNNSTTTSGNTFYVKDENGNERFYTATTSPYSVEIPADTKQMVFHNIYVNEFIHFPTGLELNNYSSMLNNFKGTNLVVSDVNMGGVTEFNGSFFLGADHLQTIDLRNWKWTNAQTFLQPFSNIFGSCGTKIYINGWELPKITNLRGLFTLHSKATAIYASDVDMSKITSFERAFHGCSNLFGIDVTNWNVNVANVTNTDYMFDDCTSLSVINLGSVTQEQYDWWYQRLVDAGIQDNVTLNHTII